MEKCRIIPKRNANGIFEYSVRILQQSTIPLQASQFPEITLLTENGLTFMDFGVIIQITKPVEI